MIKNPVLQKKIIKKSIQRCGFPFLISYIVDKAAKKAQRKVIVNWRIVGKIQLGCFIARCTLAVCLIVSSVGYTTSSFAASESYQQYYDINVPSLNAAEALNRLAEQTGATFLFPFDVAEARRANPVIGRYSLMDALALLLKGSGLSVGLSQKGVLMISLSESETVNTREEGNMKTKNSLLATAMAFLFSSGNVSQQALAAEGGHEDESLGLGIEEVIVTAQKRAQSIQEVPIAITAFEGQVSRDLGWDSPIDIISQTPNLVGQSLIGTTQPTFYIRGIGTSDLHHSAQSPVGVYVDEVYLNSTIAQGFQLFDLERVEVLRGPQGTLWGKNTTGGAMNFVSAKATHETSGYVEITYGLYNDDTPDIKLEGVINSSLVEDVLAARVSVKANVRDGWVKNEFDGSDIEELNRFAGRLSLAYTPNDNLDATLSLTVGRQRGDHVVLHHQHNPNPSAFTVLPYTENSSRDRVSQDRDAPEDVDYTGAHLKIDWDRPYGTFTSITGYSNVERDEDADADASPFNAGGGPFRNESKQWSQELRFTSPQEDKLRWITGAFYFNETIDGSTTIVDGPDGFGPFCPPTNVCAAQNDEDRERESYAFYGSFDYDLTEDLTLTGGVRWTHDEEELGIGLFYYSANPNTALDGTPASITPGTLFIASDSNVNVLDESWSEATGDLTLTYSFDENVNVYGKISRGYLAGTHVIPFAFLSEVNTLDPEEIDAFETGIKMTLLDNRLQLNLAGFYYDYSNIQVSRVDPANAGQGQRRENAASADVYGFEAEFKYRPSDRLYISGGLGYTDSSYNDFLSFNGNTNSIDDFSGKDTLNTPEWNANTLLLYTIPLEVGSIELQTDWTYQSKLYFAPDNNSLEIGEERAVGNVAVRYISENEKWRLTAFAKNVLDKEYTVNVRDFSAFWGLNLEVIGPPRVIGVTLDVSF